MTPIEEYALDLIIEGADSCIEDDLNEDGELSENDHETACELAARIVAAIRANPTVLLELEAAHGDNGEKRPRGEAEHARGAD